MDNFKIKNATNFYWQLRFTLLITLVLAGCSNTIMIRSGQNIFLNKPGTLVTMDGKNIKTIHALIKNDSIFAIESEEGSRITMSVNNARNLWINTRVQGTLQGLFLFSGIGAILCAIPDPNCGDPCLTPNGGVGGSLFCAALMAPMGALIGARVGGHKNYLFEHANTEGQANINTNPVIANPQKFDSTHSQTTP